MALSATARNAIETAALRAKEAHSNAHNAAFLKGKGNTKGATNDLSERWDTLILAYSHLTAGRADRTAFTAETLIADLDTLTTDCEKRAGELGFNAKTHADSFALLTKPRRRAREERAQA